MSSKRIALPLAALALLLALAGCGGGDEGATTTGATSAQQGGGGEGSAESRERGSTANGAEPLDTASLPEPIGGSKRAAPGVPVSEGGDNSIQTWGVEASTQEREEVTQTLQAFYDARAAGDWAEACTYLAARAKDEFVGFVKGKRGNAACAEAMRVLATGVPPSAFDREARIGYVLSLRVGEGNAFLIYTRPGENKVYANAFAEEGGTWKAVSVGPTVVY